MTALSARDLSAILETSERLACYASPAAFARAAEQEIAALIPCDNAVFNHAVDVSDYVNNCLSPDRALPADRAQYFNDLAIREHPLILYSERTGDPRARLLSDVASLTELRRLEIYNEFLRPFGINRQMATLLPARFALMVGCAFGRGGRDFTDRDRAVLDLLRQQLALVFDNMMQRVALSEALRTQDRALEAAGRGVVLLSGTGRIIWCSAQADRWLHSYFPGERRDGLPAQVSEWLAARRAGGVRDAAAGQTVPEELAVSAADGVLSLRLLPAATPEWDALIVEERLQQRSSPKLQDLTARERQVLHAMASGLDDRAIGRTLEISLRTVHKHREHLYAKIGVQTRAAAVLYALRTAAP